MGFEAIRSAAGELEALITALPAEWSAIPAEEAARLREDGGWSRKQAGQQAQGGAGRFEREGRRDAPGALLAERAGLGSDEQLVAVFALAGAAARIEIGRDALNGLDGKRGGQEVVESAQPAARGQIARGLEGGDLSERVDAGVGASGE